MTHRFFVPASAVGGERVVVEGEQARQIASVLRLASGDRIVAVRDGEELEVALETVGARRAEGRILARRPAENEPRLQLTLALPLLRGDRGEEVVEAVTQLGVARILPFTSARSVVRDLSAAKRTRWERIARESAETARRGRVPEIGALLPWSALFGQLAAPVFVAWEGTREPHLRDAIRRDPSALSLVVGPEGGLTEEEVALARDRGASLVSLGLRNLRSETAAVAAVAIALALADV